MKINIISFYQSILWYLLFATYSANCFSEWSGSLTGATDYIWRGYSKSDGKPVMQINLDYEFKNGVYVGAYMSTIDFADDGFQNPSKIEFRPYLGWGYQVSEDWRFDLEWIRYIYNGRVFGENVDYNEFYFIGHFRDLLTANISFSENSYQQNHASFNTEIVGRYPITDSLEISALFGYSNQDKVLHYNFYYWNIGMAWYHSSKMGLDIRYYNGEIFGPDIERQTGWQFDPHIANRVVFSFTLGF